MPLTCTVCAHPQRAAIDAALSAGTSLRDVAGRHGVGRSAAHRHVVGCLRMGAPAGRLRALVDREALVEIAADTLTRAREALDDAEGRRDRRGAAVALTGVLRAVETASRVLPDAEAVTNVETVALLRTLAEDVDDPDARDVIAAGLLNRGADDLARALDQVWARRPAALTTTRQEIAP